MKARMGGVRDTPVTVRDTPAPIPAGAPSKCDKRVNAKIKSLGRIQALYCLSVYSSICLHHICLSKMSLKLDDADAIIGKHYMDDDIRGGSKKVRINERGDESPDSEAFDDDYAATQDIDDILRPIVTRGRGNPSERIVYQEVEDEEEDGEIDDAVAEEPGNIHHRVINLVVPEYAEPRAIVAVNGTTQVAIIGDMLLEAVRKGRTDLVEAVIGLRGLPHTPWMDRRMETAPATIVKSLVSMMCTVSTRFLGHLIMGQITRARIIEAAIVAELGELMASGNSQPAIYTNFIVDERGFGPSPREWADVLSAIYKYMQAGKEGDAYAKVIDGVYGLALSNTHFAGARKYLSTERSLELGVFAWRDRVAVMEQFLSAMEERMGDTPNPDQRMVRPLSEVGYSCQPVKRLKAHHEQHSSNFVMGLCMAILEEEYPRARFRLAQHVIVRVYEPQGAALGETFITALMQAYTINAGGFSHAAAGTSISSAKRVTDEKWKAFRNSLAEEENYLRRVSLETARLKREVDTATNQQDVASCLDEIGREKRKQEAMWEEIERTALEVQKRAEAEIDVIKRMRDAFL